VNTLWILVPSRGRPANIDRLVRTCALTCQADTHLHFGFDDDDPALADNITAAAHHRYEVRPRMGLAPWTNYLAGLHLMDSDALASLGDDMVPVTDGWDAGLAGELERRGGGVAYPFDGRRSDIPECFIVSTPIVRALGWLAFPGSDHWFIDTALGDVAKPDRLFYRKDITVRHLHPNVAGGDPHDQTYEDASGRLGRDLAAYQRWRLMDMPRDRETVRQACSDPAS
jgi:hypothetical protein